MSKPIPFVPLSGFELSDNTRLYLANLYKKYDEVSELKEMTCLHIYPTKQGADPDGYVDAVNCHVFGFNDEWKMVYLGVHDGLDLKEAPPLKVMRAFADGALFVRFASPVTVTHNGQELWLKKV
jgi:hypothetical protein